MAKTAELWTIGDVAKACGLGRGRVAQLMECGEIKAAGRTVGGVWLFDGAAVAVLIERRRKAPRGRGRGQVQVAPP